MPHVILINVHGGYPTAMVKRSFCELPGFARLAKISHTNDRVYPTNVCAGPSLHDIFMDAPLGTMSDSVWHAWAFVQHATRSIFTCSSSTAIGHGCLGLWPGPAARPLDAHAHRRARPRPDALNVRDRRVR